MRLAVTPPTRPPYWAEYAHRAFCYQKWKCNPSIPPPIQAQRKIFAVTVGTFNLRNYLCIHRSQLRRCAAHLFRGYRHDNLKVVKGWPTVRHDWSHRIRSLSHLLAERNCILDGSTEVIVHDESPSYFVFNKTSLITSWDSSDTGYSLKTTPDNNSHARKVHQ